VNERSGRYVPARLLWFTRLLALACRLTSGPKSRDDSLLSGPAACASAVDETVAIIRGWFFD